DSYTPFHFNACFHFIPLRMHRDYSSCGNGRQIKVIGKRTYPAADAVDTLTPPQKNSIVGTNKTL
ncbi:MAG: hypothetical protein ACYS8S_04110, partial [Planctomycetota bacterium]